MTPPRWRPLPSLVGLDPRVRHVSDDARGVWFLLVCASDVDGVISAGGEGMIPSDVVRAIAGCSRADVILDELTRAGLVEIDVDGELILPDVPRWQAEHAPRGAQARATAPDQRSALEEARAPERRALANRLVARWSERGLKDAAARLAWIDSDVGRTYLAERGIDLDAAREIASSAGQRRGVFGRDRNPVTRGPSTGATEPPDRCHETATNGATRGTGTGATAATPTALRCPTEERITGLDVASLLDEMRRVSGDRMSRRATSAQELDFARAVADLASNGTARADVLRAAKHIPHVSWLEAKTVTVSWLVKDGAKLLVDLVAGADDCAHCRVVVAPRTPAAVRVDRAALKAIEDAQIAATIAAERERREAKKALVGGAA